MTIPNLTFNPTNGLLDTATYPTKPATETAARQQFMDLYNQLRDFLNNQVAPKALDKTGDTMTGNLGVGVTPGIQTIAGRRYLTIKGSTDAGFVEIATNSADGDLAVIGGIQAVDVNSTNADKRVANIVSRLKGATANNRGSEISFSTKADNGALTERVVITNDGRVLLNNHPMAEVVSGGYKIQSGTIAAANAGTYNVTFPTAFSTTPVIATSYFTNNVANGVPVSVTAVSSTAATFYQGTNQPGGVIHWIAIGS